MTDTAAPRPRHTPGERVRRAMLADGAANGLAGVLPLDWIGHSGASVADTLITWDRGELAELTTGRAWDIVQFPRPAGWETIRHLRALGILLGPVLHEQHHVDVFVAPGAAADWDLEGAAVMPAGEQISVPHPGIVAPHTMRARTWIVPPRGDGWLTDACDLYGAYAAALATLAQQRGDR